MITYLFDIQHLMIFIEILVIIYINYMMLKYFIISLDKLVNERLTEIRNELKLINGKLQ